MERGASQNISNEKNPGYDAAFTQTVATGAVAQLAGFLARHLQLIQA